MPVRQLWDTIIKRKSQPVAGPAQVPRPELFGQPLTTSDCFSYALGLVAALLAWLLLRPKKRRGEPFNKVPGGLPFIGVGHKLGRMEDLVSQFEAWLDQHGGEDGVCECDIAGMRYVII